MSEAYEYPTFINQEVYGYHSKKRDNGGEIIHG